MTSDRSTWPPLLRLGWPVAATGAVRVTMRTVDLLVVGLAVGASGVAALGIGDAATRLVLMTALGLGAGTVAAVSQRTGAGRRAAADEAAGAAATWIRVNAGVTVLRALYGVLRGAMQGAGDTRSPLVATAVGVLLFSLGFSWLVGIRLGVGLAGVYGGVLLDPLVRTALLYRWYDRGRWRRALVHAEVGGAVQPRRGGRLADSGA